MRRREDRAVRRRENPAVRRRAVGRRRIALALLALAALVPGTSAAHEERMVVGRVLTIDAARRLLVMTGPQDGLRRRLEVNPETEVIACRAAVGLGALHPGATVRVKYLDRGGASEVQSILVLGGGR